MRRDEPLDDLLLTKGINYEPLGEHMAYAIQNQWLKLFASKVKAKTGKYILDSLMWNGFSSGYENCLSEGLALEAYRKCFIEPFYLFNEGIQQCYYCACDHFPVFLGCLNDIYIFPESMKWTMVFTHEEGWLGPYFAENQDTD